MRGGTAEQEARRPLRALPGAVLLALAALTALGTLAAAWGTALGDGRHEACTSRGVPYGPPHETWHVQVSGSTLPLGVSCTWTDPATGDAVRQEPPWTPTVVAGAGAGLGAAWLVAAGLSRLGRRAASEDVWLP
ncbi:hypothetical protein ABC795_17685 [Blastococcus sp. HT6-30]|uniref:hypothetical protein n=1 Tax=Blastococcus sp. HT6-30 TaxID=3144843 RepID=UPI00321A7120